ncbi:hypothetical protein G6F56_013695 [Rhizopus delemar]|nr:hypothetical protein G6F56_013695 [Rhizopus delemar]
MQRPSAVTQLEKQFYETIQCIKGYVLVFYSFCLSLYDTLQTAFTHLWQFDEFRLGVYVFAILSGIPLVLFLVLSILVIIVTTVLLSIVWAASVLSILGLALLFLIPVLVTCLLTAALVSAVYLLYRYAKNDSSSIKIDKTGKYVQKTQ